MKTLDLRAQGVLLSLDVRIQGVHYIGEGRG